MQKYKLIFFDADNTLFNYRKSEYFSLKRSCKKFNIKFKETLLKKYEEINNELWKLHEKGLLQLEELKVLRFKKFLDYFNIKNIEPILFSNVYLSFLSNSVYLIKNCLKIIKYLYNKKYLLAIITNGLQKVQQSRFYKSKISKYFIDIFISEEIGFSKPDTKIFEYALKKLNFFDKKSILMVGDSLTSDIQGAINFSIDCVYYNPDKKIIPANINPDYEINNLIELKKIL